MVALDAEILGAMEHQPPLLTTMNGLCYRGIADYSAGDWHCFAIGVHGEVAPDEVDTMWPNQVRISFSYP